VWNREERKKEKERERERPFSFGQSLRLRSHLDRSYSMASETPARLSSLDERDVLVSPLHTEKNNRNREIERYKHNRDLSGCAETFENV
jgi:hypothetical protein